MDLQFLERRRTDAHGCWLLVAWQVKRFHDFLYLLWVVNEGDNAPAFATCFEVSFNAAAGYGEVYDMVFLHLGHSSGLIS